MKDLLRRISTSQRSPRDAFCFSSRSVLSYLFCSWNGKAPIHTNIWEASIRILSYRDNSISWVCPGGKAQSGKSDKIHRYLLLLELRVLFPWPFRNPILYRITSTLYNLHDRDSMQGDSILNPKLQIEDNQTLGHRNALYCWAILPHICFTNCILYLYSYRTCCGCWIRGFHQRPTKWTRRMKNWRVTTLLWELSKGFLCFVLPVQYCCFASETQSFGQY